MTSPAAFTTPAIAYTPRQAIQQTLSILYDAAGRGTKAKPTVAELNRIVDLLEVASDGLWPASRRRPER